MRNDRLRRDKDELHNLDDLINARQEHISHIGQDIDAFGEDIRIPDDIDVDEALTFPHPKHKKTENVELMDTPHEEDMDEDWDAQDIQPTDYEHDYNEAINTYATDNPDEIAEDEIHLMGHVDEDEVASEETTDIMPSKFTPDEETVE